MFLLLTRADGSFFRFHVCPGEVLGGSWRVRGGLGALLERLGRISWESTDICKNHRKITIWGSHGGVLGGVPGRSWGALGASWGLLGALWGLLGPSWSVLRASWSVLKASWGVLGRLGAVLGPSGGRLGAVSGPSRGRLGAMLAELGAPSAMFDRYVDGCGTRQVSPLPTSPR